MKKWNWRHIYPSLFLGLATILLVLGLCVHFPGRVSAQENDIPDHPAESTVLDEGGYLSTDTINEINDLNKTWMNTDERLMVMVYMTDHLPYNDLNGVANETFRKWKPGYSGTDNGVLVLIDMENRKFRIETSDNASTKVTDIQARHILDSSRDYFRNQDYNGGVGFIVSAIGDTFYGRASYDEPVYNESQLLLTDRERQELEENNSNQSFLNLDILGNIAFWGFLIFSIFFGKRNKDDDDDDRPGGGGSSSFWSSSHSSSSSRSSSADSFSSRGGFTGGGGGGGGASSGW